MGSLLQQRALNSSRFDCPFVLNTRFLTLRSNVRISEVPMAYRVGISWGSHLFRKSLPQYDSCPNPFLFMSSIHSFTHSFILENRVLDDQRNLNHFWLYNGGLSLVQFLGFLIMRSVKGQYQAIPILDTSECAQKSVANIIIAP